MKAKGIVAAGNIHVAEAAAEVLRAGGNAFDAAIAAAWTTYVAETTITSAAGAGFMTAFTANGESRVFDYFCQTPIKKKTEGELHFYPVVIDFGVSTQVFHAGLASVAMPGNVAGLFHIHKRLGTMPFHELAQPAIKLAREGFAVTPFFHYCLKLVGPSSTSMPTGKKLFMPNGNYPEVGDMFYMRQFADTVEYLAKHGPDEFYKGEIAQKIVADCESLGGYLTMEDFAQYRVLEHEPLRIQYRDHEICTNPPPSAGGSLAAFTLKLMEKENLRKAGFGSPKHLNMLANAMRITSVARAARLDDYLQSPQIRDYFFDKAFLAKLQAQLSGQAMKIGSTTHFTIADAKRNIASVTSSSGEGSGYAIPGTEIMMNNMLGEEDLNPKGFHQFIENQRISSMMAPTILLKNGLPVMATGTGGANRIRSTIAQMISNCVDFDMNAEEAVLAPRIHWDGNRLDIEPGFPEESINAIKMPEHFDKKFWDERAFYFGGAHTVGIDSDGTLRGVGDFRRTGAVIAV